MKFTNKDLEFLNKYDFPKLRVSQNIAVGLSGGVDSSVTALVLKAQGHKVTGIFMKNWEEDSPECTATLDFNDVEAFCQKFDIPYYAMNFAKEYKSKVFEQFLEDYRQGHTPNPDIFCNREIKFDHFFNSVMKMGFDLLATGHYAQTNLEKSFLLKGIDNNKDQSYFLSGVRKHVFQKVIFPLGKLEKSQVREIAHYFDLPNKEKKDSTGVCFIGERNFRKFLKDYICSQVGEFRTLDQSVVGVHEGACFYTLGQRKGLGLGGPGEPWYVVDKDSQQNIVYVERQKDHPRLFKSGLVAEDLNFFIDKNLIEQNKIYTAKIRHRQKDQECRITLQDENTLKVDFLKNQRAVCKRQFIALYDQEQCIVGGVIASAF
jgi:tRNA-specific 2-thiouridylase